MKKIFMIEKREALPLTKKELTEREDEGVSIAIPLTCREMSARCECSALIITRLESGEWPCTHPHIAARIAKEYGLTVDEYNQIVHESHHVTSLPKPKPKPKSGGVYDAWRSGWGRKEEGVWNE